MKNQLKSQENTSARVFFEKSVGLEACKFIKKETSALMLFPVNFTGLSKYTTLDETLKTNSRN